MCQCGGWGVCVCLMESDTVDPSGLTEGETMCVQECCFYYGRKKNEKDQGIKMSR